LSDILEKEFYHKFKILECVLKFLKLEFYHKWEEIWLLNLMNLGSIKVFHFYFFFNVISEGIILEVLNFEVANMPGVICILLVIK
jgi:hypothetical protein